MAKKGGGGVPWQMNAILDRILEEYNQLGPQIASERGFIAEMQPFAQQSLRAAYNAIPLGFDMRAFERAKEGLARASRANLASQTSLLRQAGISDSGTLAGLAAASGAATSDILGNLASNLQRAIPGQLLQRAQIAATGTTPSLFGSLLPGLQTGGNIASQIGQIQAQNQQNILGLWGDLGKAFYPLFGGGKSGKGGGGFDPYRFGQTIAGGFV